jgi:NifU-like protein
MSDVEEDLASDAETRRIQRIAAVIESVRPRLKKDGGDVELVGVSGLFVKVHLSGACVNCAMAGQTLGGIRRELMAALNEPVRIVPVPG